MMKFIFSPLSDGTIEMKIQGLIYTETEIIGPDDSFEKKAINIIDSIRLTYSERVEALKEIEMLSKFFEKNKHENNEMMIVENNGEYQ